MTEKELQSIVKGVVPVLKELLQLRDTRIHELEARLAALDAKALKAAGVWKSGTPYEPGDCATFSGSLWRCTEAHVSDGLVDHAKWELCVKRGRDGKSAR